MMAPVTIRMSSMCALIMITLQISRKSSPLDAITMVERPQMLGSVINVRKGIEHLFLAAIKMMFPLFLESFFVEI